MGKFVKYLPRFGWKPVVLSARPGYYPLQDESLLRDIPSDVRVERTFSLEPGRGALAEKRDILLQFSLLFGTNRRRWA